MGKGCLGVAGQATDERAQEDGVELPPRPLSAK
jgi:hypothetical protein